MKTLVVGGGGREHALCWKLGQSPGAEILCVPGNAGIEKVARCISTAVGGIEGIVRLCKSEEIELVVIGPEAELAAGLVDRLREEGILAFGPTAAAARLEASKAFAKEVMAEAGVPTASHEVHGELESALGSARRRDGYCVVKADGLAAGKGVTVCRGMDEAERALRDCLEARSFGGAGAKVVVEDLLEGEELSVLALCGGTKLLPMVAAQDHKAVFDGDRGPNTGGMGAYAPAPLGDRELLEKVRARVLEPTAAAMVARGAPITGVLYAGLMICGGEPYVLEFNVRFGDPETQPLLALLETDLLPLCEACARGELTGREPLEFREGSAVCVVMAAGGYPGSYQKGTPIEGLEDAGAMEDVIVFHAGTKRGERGHIVTSGGRVLGVTGLGEDVRTARERAYEAVSRIHFAGEQHRTDIAARALGRST